MDEITARKQRVYTERFRQYGPTSQGVGWGADATRSYRQMLDVIWAPDRKAQPPVSFLDVGCGYGGLLEFAKGEGLRLNYTGVDVVPEMIDYGRSAHPEAQFVCTDFFALEDDVRFDYVACNGLLTDRFEASLEDFSVFVEKVMRRAFALSNIGMAANLMTSKVNYEEKHMFYMDPVRLLDFCLNNLTTKVRLDHAHERYDYVIHAYHRERTF